MYGYFFCDGWVIIGGKNVYVRCRVVVYYEFGVGGVKMLDKKSFEG